MDLGRHTPDRMVQRTEIFTDAHKRFRMTEEIEPNDAQQLTGTMMERILKAARIDEIEASLPGLDCGSCHRRRRDPRSSVRWRKRAC